MRKIQKANSKFLEWLINRSQECMVFYHDRDLFAVEGSLSDNFGDSSRMLKFLNIPELKAVGNPNGYTEIIGYKINFCDLGSVDMLISQKLEDVRSYRLSDSFPDEYYWWMSVMGDGS